MQPSFTHALPAVQDDLTDIGTSSSADRFITHTGTRQRSRTHTHTNIHAKAQMHAGTRAGTHAPSTTTHVIKQTKNACTRTLRPAIVPTRMPRKTVVVVEEVVLVIVTVVRVVVTVVNVVVEVVLVTVLV